jgi:hypothetical protein
MQAATGAMRAAGPAPDAPVSRAQTATFDRARSADTPAATSGAAVGGGAYASSPAGVAADEHGLPDGITEREMPGSTPPEAMEGPTQADRERTHGTP